LKLIPKCKHRIVMECGKDPNSIKCQEVVKKVVPTCGHLNEMSCSTDTMSFNQCNEMLWKELLCGHKMKLKCCDAIPTDECREKTLKRLPHCDHLAEMLCSDNNLHAIKCSTMVQKTLPCLHKKAVECYEDIFDVECSEKVTVMLPCGHRFDTLCCEKPDIFYDENGSIDLSEFPICHEQITITLPCKHLLTVECCNQNNATCNAPCGVQLCCGHTCSGSCKLCFQSGSHPLCKESCKKKLVCGHGCQSSTCISCTLCNEICESYCPHTACDHMCGMPCDPCNEQGTRSCQHYSCSKLCFEYYDRPRCAERCPKKLECSHQCLGYCGEPCPNICSACDPFGLATISENQDISTDEIFIVSLQKCGHEFLAEKLDKLFEDSDVNHINCVCCSSCRSTIQWHPRYGNTLKRLNRLQNKAKSKLFIMDRDKINIVKFPIVGPNFDELSVYWKQCNTFLFPQQRLLSEAKRVLEMSNFTLKYLIRVEAVLRPIIDDMEQLEAATNYPVFEGILSVHVDDWTLCKEGI